MTSHSLYEFKTYLPAPRPMKVLLAGDHTWRVVSQLVEVFGDDRLEGFDHLGAVGHHLLHPGGGVGGGHWAPSLLTQTLLQGGVLLHHHRVRRLVLDGVHQTDPSLRPRVELGDRREVLGSTSRGRWWREKGGNR